MELKDLLKKPLPPIPAEIAAALGENRVTGTRFEEKNAILADPALQREVGYKRLEDGTYLVAMTCPMPGITPDMIEWWFWWHPRAGERYRAWFPGEHLGISYGRKNRDYFRQPRQPRFEKNTQYPTERIGGLRMPLRIDFVGPAEFGFSGELMEKNDIPLILCGHVGAFRGAIRHTEMAHIFRKTGDGLLLISRFWIGETLKQSLLRKRILTDQTALGMAEHCCIEYRNLAGFLPELYRSEHR